MSGNLLATVVAAARTAADHREGRRPLVDVERALASARPPDGHAFRRSLRAPGVRIIAECKRRSPSRGVLRPDYDPVAIATGYEAHGAAAISILTEPTFFDGSLDHLAAVRAAVQLPLLRKDFIVTPYQIAEAALAGADAILLIVAALDDTRLRDLLACADSYGLAALVEVHDGVELDRAASSGADVIGVNSRNLRTLSVDTDVLATLGPRIPHGAIAVAESGLKTVDDIARCHAAGYRAFLIGERFMTVADPGAALGELHRAAEAVVA